MRLGTVIFNPKNAIEPSRKMAKKLKGKKPNLSPSARLF